MLKVMSMLAAMLPLSLLASNQTITGMAKATLLKTVEVPAEYERVEYIQSSGSQRIKTGITPADTDTIEMQIFPQKIGSRNQCLWCSRGGTTKAATFTAFLMKSGKFRFDRNGAIGTETNAANLRLI